MTTRIAIVGMACRYADAVSPDSLWETVLSQRRAFRRLPPERLSAADYFAANRAAPDRVYAWQAAVLEGYSFDRARFRVGLPSFKSTDIAHWLALDVAASALEDAGFPDGDGLPRDETGVIVGNTLTGEMSRSALLRLRWPYVGRHVAAALATENWPAERQLSLLGRIERSFKEPFAPIGDESLAGGLANTIAGRICNQFDLKGGGFVVDGACSSSLLAIAQATAALTTGDLDAAVVGGVDISLDPFELVGFAKVGALTPDQMRVYDRKSVGFIPGEGSGFLVLMREDDARRRGVRIRALIAGCGIASDGRGGITRPEASGERRAVERAYRRAGFGPETVALFEGHGTGTTVGDAIELEMLTSARHDHGARSRAAIGSVKANIGHTKAAAGVAGFIKATLALEHETLPPTTGCDDPHPLLTNADAQLRALPSAEPWPDAPLRAGVSAFGFGGINVHIALERAEPRRRKTLSNVDARMSRSPQAAEVFLFDGSDVEELTRRVGQLQQRAEALSQAELTDAAALLASTVKGSHMRAAVVATTPTELDARLRLLREQLANGSDPIIDLHGGIYVGGQDTDARVGFLFPGQGSPSRRTAGAWGRRFDAVADSYRSLELPEGPDIATAVAQPAIVAASLAALGVLQDLGIRGDVAVGHSLGELTALASDGAVAKEDFFRLVRARARVMTERTRGDGAMVSISASPEDVRSILEDGAVVAAFNGPRLTVVSGVTPAVARVAKRAQDRAWSPVSLSVSHAFHSPMMLDAAVAFREDLGKFRFQQPRGHVISTISGNRITTADDLPTLLGDQLQKPVRFVEALRVAANDVSLLIEVGPGRALTTLASNCCSVPVVATDACAESVVALLQTVAACWVTGVDVDVRRLFDDRFCRPFDLARPFSFLANPCEQAPKPDLPAATEEPAGSDAIVVTANDPLTAVREAIIAKTALPAESIHDDARLLEDLHFSSIAVAELIGTVIRSLGLAAPKSPTDFAHATVAQLAAAIAELARGGSLRTPTSENSIPAGVQTWMRNFAVELVPQHRPGRIAQDGPGSWEVFGDHALVPMLRGQLASAVGGRGVALVVSGRVDVPLVVEATRRALDLPDGGRFVLVQDGASAASWAQTLQLERPQLIVNVVTAAVSEDAIAWIVAEVASLLRYSEAVYDASGTRHVPRWSLCSNYRHVGPPKVDASDTILVTGGGKGIGAECAMAWAAETGATLVLLGRGDANRDPELIATLQELDARKLRWRYHSCDITDTAAVTRTLADEVGITAVLHSAGINHPRAIGELDVVTVRQTLAVKLDGLHNVLGAIDSSKLKALVSFGSIIGATGLQGEAHYGLANELLAHATEAFQADHPACFCLTIAWSAWSGVGMAERLGRIESLRAAGVDPLPREQATSHFLELLRSPPSCATVIVSGRFGSPPTISFEEPPLPLLRFLEKPRLHIPGVEIVVDVNVSAGSDPYLTDHVVDGVTLFPAVLSLEAMAQVGAALANRSRIEWFENLEFGHPIIVPSDGRATLRVCALCDGPRITVVMRSSTTDFAVDHVRGTCRIEPAPTFAPSIEIHGGTLPDVERDMYGALLFQRGRFRRLAGYRALSAWGCEARISPHPGKRWFSDSLPQELLTGDLGARDATMHALQACVPNRTLLPIAVERLRISEGQEPASIVARERTRRGTRYIYDVQVWSAAGECIEEWSGLQLETVGGSDRRAWPIRVIPAYLERKLADLGMPDARAAIETGASRESRTPGVVRSLFGASDWRHHKGRIHVDGGQISVSHTDDWTLAIRSRDPVGCDAEVAVDRPTSVWRELLASDAHDLAVTISRECMESESTASTRVWAAREALKKLGFDGAVNLHLQSRDEERWIELSTPEARCWTWVARTVEDRPFAFAFAWRPPGARI